MQKVWVNGTFDVLHLGHIRLLEKAKSLGWVRVGIDDDHRVKQLKGDTRPFNTAEDRKEMLLALKFVDEVVIFGSELELVEHIGKYGPDYMVIGSDYEKKPIIGSHLVDSIIFFDRVDERSTTAILEHAKTCSDR